jgi:hypothetical protein
LRTQATEIFYGYCYYFFQVKVALQAEYGEVRSFYAEKYPECVQGYREPKETEAQ